MVRHWYFCASVLLNPNINIMNEENLKKLYSAASQFYDVGSEEEFANHMSDLKKREGVYKKLSSHPYFKEGIGDWGTFNQMLGFGAAPGKSSAPVQNTVRTFQSYMDQIDQIAKQPPTNEVAAGTGVEAKTPGVVKNLNRNWQKNNLQNQAQAMTSRLQQMQMGGVQGVQEAGQPTVDFNGMQQRARMRQQMQSNRMLEDARQRSNFRELFDSTIRPAVDERHKKIDADVERSIPAVGGIGNSGATANWAHYTSRHNDPVGDAEYAISKIDDNSLNEYIRKQYGTDLGNLSEEEQQQVRDEIAREIEMSVLQEYTESQVPKNDVEYIYQSAVHNNLTARIAKAMGNMIGGDRVRKTNDAMETALGAYSESLKERGTFGSWMTRGAAAAAPILLDGPYFKMFDIPGRFLGAGMANLAQRVTHSGWVVNLAKGYLARNAAGNAIFRMAGKTGDKVAKFLIDEKGIPALVGQSVSQGVNWSLYGMTGTATDRVGSLHKNEDGILVSTVFEADENGNMTAVEKPLTLWNVTKDMVGTGFKEYVKGSTLGLGKAASPAFKYWLGGKSPVLGSTVGSRLMDLGEIGLEASALAGFTVGEQLMEGVSMDNIDLADLTGENLAMILSMRFSSLDLSKMKYRYSHTPVEIGISRTDLDVMRAKGYAVGDKLQFYARMAEANVSEADLNEFGEQYKAMIQDKELPLNLRYKLRMIVEGKAPSNARRPMISSAGAVELAGGKWGIETKDSSGQVVGFEIVGSEKEAEDVITSDRLQEEMQNTHLILLEAASGNYQDALESAAADFSLQSMIQRATDPTAPAYMTDQLLDMIERDQRGEASLEERIVIGKVISNARKASRTIGEYNRRQVMKAAVERILGGGSTSHVEDALMTDYADRTQDQQRLVAEYMKQLEELTTQDQEAKAARQQQIQLAVEQATAPIDNQTNTTTGDIVKAELYDESQVHVVSGVVEVDADGLIDFDRSSSHVIIMDENGRKRMIDVNELRTVERSSVEEAKKDIADQVKAEADMQMADESNRKLAEAEASNKADAENDKQEQKQSDTTEVTDTEGEQVSEEVNKRYKYYDVEDNEHTVEVAGKDPDGRLRVVDEKGKEHLVYENELEEIATTSSEKKPEAAAAPQPTPATGEKPMYELPKTATPESKRVNGMAFDGDEPILTSVEPQEALDYLNDTLKLDKNEQIDYVVKMLSQAEAKSKEIMGLMPDIKKMNLGEYTKAKAQWEAAVDAWEKEYNHYNEMYKALKGESYFEYSGEGENGKGVKTVTAEPVDNGPVKPEAGFNVGSHSDIIPKEDSDLLNAMGKQWNMPIMAVDPSEMPEIQGKRGYYDPKTGTIYLNVANRNKKTARWIMGHEITHKIKESNPKRYENLLTAMRNRLGEGYETRLKEMLDLYSKVMDKQGIKGDEARKAYVEEEMCADLAGDLIDSDTDFARYVMAEAQKDSDYAAMHLGIVRDTINFIRDVMRKFSHLFDPESADKLYEARRAWEACYRDAVKLNGARGGGKFSIEEMKPEDSLGGDDATKETRLSDEVAPDEVEAANRDAEVNGGILHDKEGHSIGVFDKDGNLTPRFCLETAGKYEDNLGVEHEGTHKTVLDYMREKGYSKRQINAMDEKMSWWEKYMRNVMDFTDENGQFRFEAFREWNMRTPEYKSIGQQMEKALTSLVNNGEYPINLELTTDCIKREAFTQLLNEMVKIDDGRAIRNMNPAEITAIQDMMKTYGIQTACPLCFVEGKRLGIRNWAERIVHDWNCQLNDALDLGVEKVKVPLGKDDFYYAIDAEAVAEALEKKFGTADSRFNFGQGDYVSETSLDAMADMSERQRQARLVNETFDLLSGRRGGLLPDDLAQIEANAKEVEAKMLELENAWYQKNPDKPYQMTKKDAAIIQKIQNQGMNSVAKKMAQTISQYPELRKVLTLNDLIGSTGLDAIRTRNGEGYARLFSHIVSRFGAGTPKVVQRAEPYVGEILSLGNDKIDAANRIGGSRLFSFSDFDITKVFDIMQIFFDAEARGLKLQSYSKEVPYILMFGRGTNAKINMSTLVEAKPKAEDVEAYRNARTERERQEIKHRIAEYAGLQVDDNGNITGFQWSGTHSVSPEFAEAIYRNPDYNGNCGATTVGVSVNHTLYSCLTPWIRQVIPFHLSGMPIAARERTDVGWYRDATSEQNTRKVDADGKARAISHSQDFDFYEGEDKKGWDMRDRCRKYVAWCNNNGYIPRFEWALNSDNYIKWSEDNGYTPNKQIVDAMRANEREVTVKDEKGKKQTIKMFDGYYKVITDFNCYKPEFDAEGNLVSESNAPHTNIKADFVRDENMLGAIFTDEDSMLQNRENNIRNADDQVTDLAYKAIKMLKGEISLEEAKNPSAEAFKNAEDSAKYLRGVDEGRFSLEEDRKFIEDAPDLDEEQKEILKHNLDGVRMQIYSDREQTKKYISGGFLPELGGAARRAQMRIDALDKQIENFGLFFGSSFDAANARIKREREIMLRDDILKKMDEAGLKRTELDIQDGEVSQTEIEDLFDKLNTDKDSKEMFDRVMQTARQLGVRYSFHTLDYKDQRKYNGITSAGKITFNTDNFRSGLVTDDSKARTILHESLHGISEYVFFAYEQGRTEFGGAFTPEQRVKLKEAISDIKGVYDQLREDPEFAGEYGNSAYYEAFAEMSNPRFREKLKQMNLWERFVDDIKKFFRTILNPNDKATTAYEKMEKALDTILNETDARAFRYIDDLNGRFIDDDNLSSLHEGMEATRNNRGDRFSLEENNSTADTENSIAIRQNKALLDKNKDNNADFSPEIWNPSEKIVTLRKEIENGSKSSIDKAIKRWVADGGHQELVDIYQNGNVLDPDKARELLRPIGYDGSNGSIYTKATIAIQNGIYDKMLDNAVSSGNPTVTLLTGAAGSGKSYSVRNNKSVDLDNQGMVYDAALTSYDSMVDAIEKAKAKGIKDADISIVAVYNDIETAFRNTIERYKKEGRVVPLKTLIKQFEGINGNLKDISEQYPEVKIIAIDNSGNNGGKSVSLEDAFTWDYNVSPEKEVKLLNILQDEIDKGTISTDQASAIAGGLQSPEFLSEHASRMAETIAQRIREDRERGGRNDALGLKYSLEEAEKEVNTDPTEAQKKAGNYKMGHAVLDGYNITIENPKGSIRRGTDANGKSWETPMNNTYGYIRGTEGVDGDHIDIFLSDNPESGKVYVVDQVNPETGEFDEHKVMYGFESADDARKAYLSNYTKGWKGLGNITEVSKDEFKQWVNSSHRKTKPFADYKMVRQKNEAARKEFIGAPGSYRDLYSDRGEAQRKRDIMRLNSSLPDKVRSQIIDEMRSGGSYDIADATLRHFADLAENRDDSPVWNSVAKSLKEVYGVDLTPGEAKYMMWRTYRNQHPNDFSRTGLLAEDYAMRLHSGMLGGTSSPTGGDGGERTSDVRYSLEDPTGEGLGTDDRTPEQKAIDMLMEDMRRYEDELRGIQDASTPVVFRNGQSEGGTVVTQARANEIANRLRDFVRNRLNPVTGKRIGSFAINNIINQIDKARTRKDLEPIVRNIQQTISQAEIAAEIEEMEKIVNTKTQSLTPKKLVKGVLVDSETHHILENIRGSYKELLLTSKDDELKEVNREIRDLKKKYMLDSLYDPNAPQEFKDELAPLMERRDQIQKERNEIMRENVSGTVEELENRENEISNEISTAIENDEEPSRELINELVAIPIRKRLAEVRQMQEDLKQIRKDQEACDTRTRAGREEYDRLDREYMITQRRIVAQTKSVSEELKDVIAAGRSKRAEMILADIERQKNIVHMAMNAVGYGRGGRITPLDPLSKSQRSAKENFWESIKKGVDLLNSPTASLDFILRAIDHSHDSGHGPMYEFFMKSDEGAVQSRDNYTRGVREFNQSLADKALELFGDPDATYKNESRRQKATLKAWKQLINDSKKTLKDSPITLHQIIGDEENTWDINMNKGQMLNTWLTWRQEQGRVKLQGQGFTEDSIRQIEEYLGDKYLKFGEWVTEEFFPRLREEKYNPEYEKVYGTSLHRAAHYFPLNIDKSAIHDSEEIGEQKQKNMRSSASKHEVVRSNNRLPIDLSQNAFDVMMKYGQDMERTTAYAMFTKNLNTLVHSLGFGNALDTQSEGTYKAFKLAAAVATESYNPESTAVGDFFSKLHSSFMRQAISMRIYSAVKQTLSYPAFGIYSNDADFQKRFYGYVFTPRKNWKWAMEHLEGFRSREESGDFGQELMKADNIFDFLRADKPHSNKLTQGIAEVATWYRNNGMWFNKKIDGLTVAAGARAVYDYDYKKFRAQGMSHEEADKKATINAEVAFNQSQQSSLPAFSSPIQKQKDLLSRSVTAFQSSNIAYHKIALDGVKDIMEGEGSTKVRGLMKILNVGLLNGLWWAGLNPAKVYGMLCGKSTDEENEEAKDAFITNIILGYLTNGTLLGPAASAWFDSKSDYNPLQVFQQINQTVKTARNAFKKDEYGVIAMVMADYMAQAAGVNVSTFNSMYEAVANPYKRGELRWDDLFSLINLSKTNRKQIQALDVDKTFPEYMKDYFNAGRMHFVDPESNSFMEQMRSVYNKGIDDNAKTDVLKEYLKHSVPEYDDVFNTLNDVAKALENKATERAKAEKKSKNLILSQLINEEFQDEDLRDFFKNWYLSQSYENVTTDANGKKNRTKQNAKAHASTLLNKAKDAAKAYNGEEGFGFGEAEGEAARTANELVMFRNLQLKNFQDKVSDDSWQRYLKGYGDGEETEGEEE